MRGPAPSKMAAPGRSSVAGSSPEDSTGCGSCFHSGGGGGGARGGLGGRRGLGGLLSCRLGNHTDDKLSCSAAAVDTRGSNQPNQLPGTLARDQVHTAGTLARDQVHTAGTMARDQVPARAEAGDQTGTRDAVECKRCNTLPLPSKRSMPCATSSTPPHQCRPDGRSSPPHQCRPDGSSAPPHQCRSDGSSSPPQQCRPDGSLSQFKDCDTSGGLAAQVAPLRPAEGPDAQVTPLRPAGGLADQVAPLLDNSLFSPWRLVFGLGHDPAPGGGVSSSDEAEGGYRSASASPLHRAATPLNRAFRSLATPADIKSAVTAAAAVSCALQRLL